MAKKAINKAQEQFDTWFGQHQASMPNPKEIIWARPGSSMYQINYLIYGPSLFVSGDMGTSVFQSPSASLKFFSDSDPEYVLSKLAACSYGVGCHKGKQWNAEKMRQVIATKFKKTVSRNGTLIAALQACAGTYEDFHMKIYEYKPHLAEALGPDWYFEFGVMDGLENDLCVLAQIEGLKRAVAQLEAKGIEVV